MEDFEEQFLEGVRKVVQEELTKLSIVPQNASRLDNGEYLAPSEAADALGVTTSTLATWRSKGGGPAYRKCGRLVRYRKADLTSYLENRAVTR